MLALRGEIQVLKLRALGYSPRQLPMLRERVPIGVLSLTRSDALAGVVQISLAI
jgi:hypothetical protein